jgi:hypothetical protein
MWWMAFLIGVVCGGATAAIVIVVLMAFAHQYQIGDEQ